MKKLILAALSVVAASASASADQTIFECYKTDAPIDQHAQVVCVRQVEEGSINFRIEFYDEVATLSEYYAGRIATTGAVTATQTFSNRGRAPGTIEASLEYRGENYGPRDRSSAQTMVEVLISGKTETNRNGTQLKGTISFVNTSGGPSQVVGFTAL